MGFSDIKCSGNPKSIFKLYKPSTTDRHWLSIEIADWLFTDIVGTGGIVGVGEGSNVGVCVEVGTGVFEGIIVGVDVGTGVTPPQPVATIYKTVNAIIEKYRLSFISISILCKNIFNASAPNGLHHCPL